MLMKELQMSWNDTYIFGGSVNKAPLSLTTFYSLLFLILRVYNGEGGLRWWSLFIRAQILKNKAEGNKVPFWDSAPTHFLPVLSWDSVSSLAKMVWALPCPTPFQLSLAFSLFSPATTELLEKVLYIQDLNFLPPHLSLVPSSFVICTHESTE